VSSPGKVEIFNYPTNFVKKGVMTDLGDLALQNADAVAITGGSVVGATLAGKVQEIAEAGAISLDANHVKLTGSDAGDYAVTLAAPSRGGQVMVIEMVATTGVNAVTLALTNVVGGSLTTSASFDAAGETLVLVSTSTKWVVLKEQGVTLS
jgi:hypothetical protein